MGFVFTSPGKNDSQIPRKGEPFPAEEAQVTFNSLSFGKDVLLLAGRPFPSSMSFDNVLWVSASALTFAAAIGPYLAA